MDTGRDAVRHYVSEQAARGRDHVVSLVEADNLSFITLIGDLTEAEGMAVTSADEWSVFDVLRHMSTGLERSRLRIETLSSGRPFVTSPPAPGQASVDYVSFEELRRAYVDGIAAVIDLLHDADPDRGLELTTEHAAFGPFNWLEWAVFLHYVHTNDHRGQIEAIVADQRERKA